MVAYTAVAIFTNHNNRLSNLKNPKLLVCDVFLTFRFAIYYVALKLAWIISCTARCTALNDTPLNGENSPKSTYRVCKSSKPMDRPNQGDPKNCQLITVLMDIGGHKALTLMDSGCTIEALSPTHVQLANGKVHQLADQHSLQLGTVGSRAKFNYGTTMKTSYGGIVDNVYFNIVNIDRYDAIVGTHYM